MTPAVLEPVHRYECDTCHDVIEPGVRLELPRCCEVRKCSGELQRVSVCDVCRTREAACGSDQCLSCICDAVVEDPAELDGCARSLQIEVAKVLASRLQPFLRVRQAA